jgi:K+-transporting ATPase KdpF subunit
MNVDRHEPATSPVAANRRARRARSAHARACGRRSAVAAIALFAAQIAILAGLGLVVYAGSLPPEARWEAVLGRTVLILAIAIVAWSAWYGRCPGDAPIADAAAEDRPPSGELGAALPRLERGATEPKERHDARPDLRHRDRRVLRRRVRIHARLRAPVTQSARSRERWAATQSRTVRDAHRAAKRRCVRQSRASPLAASRIAAREENNMNVESTLSLVTAALLLVYLGYALLRPERF